MRLPHIVGGAIACGLGLLGVYDEYFVVIEFLKGMLPVAMVLLGLVAVVSGMARFRPSTGHIVTGLILVALAVYGFYDEYYAVLDFTKGGLPLTMAGIGTIAVLSGVKRLR